MKRDLNQYTKTLEGLLLDINLLQSFEATASTFCQEVLDNITAVDTCCYKIRHYLSSKESNDERSKIRKYLENVSSITYEYCTDVFKIRKMSLFEIRGLLGQLIDRIEGLIYQLNISQR